MNKTVEKVLYGKVIMKIILWWKKLKYVIIYIQYVTIKSGIKKKKKNYAYL